MWISKSVPNHITWQYVRARVKLKSAIFVEFQVSKKILHIVVLCIFYVFAAYPQDSGMLTNQQQAFIDLLYPQIVKVNNELMQQRTGIYGLYQLYLAGEHPGAEERAMLLEYFDFYGVDEETGEEESGISRARMIRLLSRVDVIPVDHTIARAVIESDWGKNTEVLEGFRFFRTGHEYTSGNDTDFYFNVADAIREFAFVLNTHPEFSHYRDVRATARINGEKPQNREMIRSLFFDKSGYHHQIKRILSDINTYLPLAKGDDNHE